MKHAYLIMAHNEFDVLKELIRALDFVDNDIYIHYDKKVKKTPIITTNHSALYIIKDRINVHWGDVSQIKAEYSLFETAYNTNIKYSYYHLISGVHFPLRSQNDIHSFFDNLKEKSVLCLLPWTLNEIQNKIGRYHFFVSGLYSKSKINRIIHSILWRICLRLQANIYLRDMKIFSGKYSNWVSISRNDIAYVINNKTDVMKLFNHTLCSDELFIPYIFKRYGLDFIEYNLLFQDFDKASPKILDYSDYDRIIESKALFARKFNNQSIQLLKKIIKLWEIK